MKKILLLFCVQLNAWVSVSYLKEKLRLPEAVLLQTMNHLAYIEQDAENSWKHYYHLLSNLINERDLKVGCEIGVSTGGHSDYVLANTKVEKLYSIDPFIKNATLDLFSPDYFYDVMYYRVLFRLSRYGERSTLIRDFSTNTHLNFSMNSLDFVFIDGSHEYEDVKKDLELYYDKVKNDGIVAGDDYNTGFAGVPKAVNEFFEKKGKKVNIDSQFGRVWWVFK